MNRVLALCVLVLAACGGDDPPSGPGPQTLPPGTQPPPGAETTSVSCSANDPCDYWFCRCDDGAVVNASYCANGACSAASAICPTACETFQHGGWTGIAGGGPDQPPPSSCGGLGSSNAACNACFADQCCSEGERCSATSGCYAHWDCVVGCGGDPACRADCEDAASSAARAAYDALEGCLLGSCSGACS